MDEKPLRDRLRELEQKADQDPSSASVCFQIAETHEQLGNTDLAVHHYRIRGNMPEQPAERYQAMVKAGTLGNDLFWLLRAWEARPAGIEPLQHAARLLTQAGLTLTARKLLAA